MYELFLPAWSESMMTYNADNVAFTRTHSRKVVMNLFSKTMLAKYYAGTLMLLKRYFLTATSKIPTLPHTATYLLKRI